jgi:preprotein translocase subunit YajC
VIGLVFLAAMLILFWVLIVMPQRRQRAAQQQILTQLAPGDEVMTAGGLYGTVREVADRHVELEIAPGTQVRLAKTAITARSEHEQEPSESSETPLP